MRGGEPVIRETRIPVYAIARQLELGSTEAELYEDHPRLEEGDLEVARQYAKLYPRRGRPRGERAGECATATAQDFEAPHRG